MIRSRIVSAANNLEVALRGCSWEHMDNEEKAAIYCAIETLARTARPRSPGSVKQDLEAAGNYPLGRTKGITDGQGS